MEKLPTTWQDLENADQNTRGRIFIRYCNENIALKNSGNLTIEQAAYNIVAAAQFRDLSETDEFGKIFDRAGLLEIADHEYDEATKQHEWQKLVESISQSETR